MSKNLRCCICHKTIDGHGHDPIPVMASGKCCDRCQYQAVIPARIRLAKQRRDNESQTI
ncbi:MAG: hypothetical protein IJS05_06465 [Paludibacteraceae bacterium]|nr:hypothetical protein [Paludibacteraceae bacterium]